MSMPVYECDGSRVWSQHVMILSSRESAESIERCSSFYAICHSLLLLPLLPAMNAHEAKKP